MMNKRREWIKRTLGKNQSWVKKISDSEKYREGMLKKEPKTERIDFRLTEHKEGSEIEPETVSLN